MFLTKLLKKKSNETEKATSKDNNDVSNLIANRNAEKERERKALRKGELGEYKINLQLDRLPKGCMYLSDLMLPNPAGKSGYAQIDHIVITPYGLFVIETKNYSGDISGAKKDKMWLRDGKYEIFNPLRQNYGHIMTLKKVLSKYSELNYYSIVTFTLRATISDVDDEIKSIKSSELVIYDTAISETINRKINILSREKDKDLVSEKDIRQIYDQLSSSNITDNSIRQKHVSTNKSRNLERQDNHGIHDLDNKCAICGKPVSQRVKEFCLSNSSRFGGKLYCFDHQKDF